MEQGKQEILARRIGSNELDAIEVCRGYVEAQNDYAEEDTTGSGVLHYAQKIISSPGKTMGCTGPAPAGRTRAQLERLSHKRSQKDIPRNVILTTDTISEF